ncbi:MAG: hypothetical protein V1646_03880 [bacterium]
MIDKSKVIKKLILLACLVGSIMYCVFDTKTFAAETSTSVDHGWAILDSVRSYMPYPVSFYALPRGLNSRLHDGMVIRIKALKTGFGSYYKVEKRTGGGWTLKASTRDPKDPASQFLILRSGNDITLTSEVADGFLLASLPQTFDVILVNEKNLKNDKAKINTTLWELVEDPKSGDTLETCYLKNKATGGMLTASYDSAGAGDGEISALRSQIEKLEKEIPYITITYARTESFKNGNFESDLSRDIKGQLDQKIQRWVADSNGNKIYDVAGVGNILSVPAGNWVADWSGISKARWNLATWRSRPRHVKIRYMEGNDKTEKERWLDQIEGKTFQIVADPNKHPATQLRRKLDELVSKSSGLATLKTSDIGRTGYGSAPFAINQWSKVAIESVVDIGEGDDLSGEKLTIDAAQDAGFVLKNLDKIWVHKRPEFSGFFQAGQAEKPVNYGPGQIITVAPLSSKGFVWFEKMLQKSLYGTVIFRALAEQGDVQICFSDAIEPRTAYRVVFGAAGNTKTIIYKNDVSVQEIDSDQQEKARVIPGMIEQFWVSLNNGFMMVGKGDPGTNIIMAWQDSSPVQNIKRIGFSTYKSTVKYTDVQMIDNPIAIIAPSKSYVSDTKAIQVGTVNAPAWHYLPLSPPSTGTIVFQATGSEDATLVLANDKNEGYAIEFGADGNTTAKILDLQSQNELCKIDAKNLSIAKLDVGKPNKFWVSFYRGLIILGKGDIGKNTFCMYVDADVPDNIAKIGFAGKSTIQNLEIWPEVTIGFDQNVSEYVKRSQSPLVQCKLNIIVPFDYSIYQDGPMVIFKDRMSGMSTPVAGTPNPGLIYHFKLDIASDGAPRLVAGENSASPEKIALTVLVKVLEAGKDALFTTSQQMAYGTGPEVFSSLAALAGCAAVGALGAVAAAGQSAVQVKLDEMEALGKRQVNTESIARTVSGTMAVSDEAKNDRQEFEAKLKTIFAAMPVEIANLEVYQQLDYTTKLWSDALRLITDAYVVENQGTKKSVITGLSDLYTSVKNLGLSDTTASIYIRMINILIKAYNNSYLTSLGDLLDDQSRNNWYLWINNLEKDFFNSQKFMKQGIEINFKGEYLWFPVSFPQAGSGSVTFEATASSNIFVCLSENAIQQSDMLKRVYEIAIGKWGNKVTAIHREALGDSAIEFDHSKIPELSPDPMVFKKYWINIDKGIISGGVGDLGQNKLWEWADPYPAVPVKWVGFSNWLSAVTVKNVQVGSAFGVKAVSKLVAPSVPKTVTEVSAKIVPTEVAPAKDVQDKTVAKTPAATKKIVKPVTKKKVPAKTSGVKSKSAKK